MNRSPFHINAVIIVIVPVPRINPSFVHFYNGIGLNNISNCYVGQRHTAQFAISSGAITTHRAREPEKSLGPTARRSETENEES